MDFNGLCIDGWIYEYSWICILYVLPILQLVLIGWYHDHYIINSYEIKMAADIKTNFSLAVRGTKDGFIIFNAFKTKLLSINQLFSVDNFSLQDLSYISINLAFVILRILRNNVVRYAYYLSRPPWWDSKKNQLYY